MIRGVLFDWRGTLVADPPEEWWVATALERLGRNGADAPAVVEALEAASRTDEAVEDSRSPAESVTSDAVPMIRSLTPRTAPRARSTRSFTIRLGLTLYVNAFTLSLRSARVRSISCRIWSGSVVVIACPFGTGAICP